MPAPTAPPAQHARLALPPPIVPIAKKATTCWDPATQLPAILAQSSVLGVALAPAGHSATHASQALEETLAELAPWGILG
jgi:hypothetical protein